MFIPIFLLLLTVGGSVVPFVETFEQLELLPQQKYTKRQFAEIEKALLRKDEKIRVMSYNILFDLFEEELEPENHWKNRFLRVVELIEEVSPDVLGVQELYEKQLSDLESKLGDRYAFVSRDPSIGETNGIFYLKSRFELLEKNVWDTPHQSKINISDHMTEIVLKDLKTNKVACFLNTHFAFTHLETREKQADFVGQRATSQKTPFIFMGDLNTFAARPAMTKLPFFDGDYLHRLLTSYGLKDARDVSLLGHVGPLSTFTNEESNTVAFKGKGTPGIVLDHLYFSDGITVLIHAVQSAQVDGHFPSDHMPVFADILLE